MRMHGRCAHLLGTVSRYPSPDFDSPSRSFPYSMTPVSMDGSRCFHCTMAFNRRPAAIHSSQDGATKHSKLSVQRLALIPAMLHLHWPAWDNGVQKVNSPPIYRENANNY